MFLIGTHLSCASGFLRMGREALSIGANTFQFFTRNPRGARAKQLDADDMAALRQLLADNGFGKIVAHAPYTLNPCSTDPRVLELAEEMFADDLARMEHLPGNYYNFHPGSHLKQGAEAGIQLIADLLNRVMRPEQNTMVLLETMAGKGTEVGRSFQELRAIIDRVDLDTHIGVCLDSCHLSDAGYDLIHDLDGVLEEFDSIIGINRLKAFHLNDSQNLPGSRKDRHACIGKGTMGLETMIRIINHPSLRHLPFILETPLETDGHAKEIALLKQYAPKQDKTEKNK